MWVLPTSTVATTPASPETVTGTLLSSRVPLPSLPSALKPQQLTPPLRETAQVWPPAEIAATSPGRPETSTGMLLLVVEPFPSWPEPFEPQHLTPPTFVRRAGVTFAHGDRHDRWRRREVGNRVEEWRTPRAREVARAPKGLRSDVPRAHGQERPAQGGHAGRVSRHVSPGGQAPHATILTVDLESDGRAVGRGLRRAHRRANVSVVPAAIVPAGFDERRTISGRIVKSTSTGMLLSVVWPFPRLPGAVVAPALHPTCAHERAREIGAQAAQARQWRSRRRSARKRQPGNRWGARTVTELAVRVAAPAGSPTAARECARVLATHRDRCDTRREAQHIHRDQTPGLDEGVELPWDRAIPELGDMVEAPALHPAAGRQRARVLPAGCDRDHAAREAHDIRREGAGGRRAVPELAVHGCRPSTSSRRRS